MTSAPEASAPPDLVFVPFVAGVSPLAVAPAANASCSGRTALDYEVAVPVAGGWAVLEVVMSVPVDLAACVHPRFVRTDSGHRLTDRPLSASAQRGCESDSQPGTAAEKAADGAPE